MRIEHNPCLVLNSDYTPIAIIDWKKAMVWSYRSHHNLSIIAMDIIEYYKKDSVKGIDGQIHLPAVIKTKQYLKLNKKNVNFSRKNLFTRDNYTCQYCGNKYSHNDLTYDHVIPKSQWSIAAQSPTNWTNIVTACIKCNRKKSNKTPSQAKMKLINEPFRPVSSYKYLHVTSRLSIMKERIPDEWRIYTG